MTAYQNIFRCEADQLDTAGLMGGSHIVTSLSEAIEEAYDRQDEYEYTVVHGPLPFRGFHKFSRVMVRGLDLSTHFPALDEDAADERQYAYGLQSGAGRAVL